MLCHRGYLMKIMKKPLLFSIIAVIWLLSAYFVSASHITMSTRASAKASDDFVKLNISTINKGDEPAINIQFIASIANNVVASSIKPALGVNEEFSWQKNIEHSFDKPGRYPIILTISYQDANGYPSSALTASFVDFRQNLVSDVFGTIEDIELSRKARLKLRIKNNGNTEKDVSIRFITPKELSIKDAELVVKLDGKEEKDVTTTIESFSALSGSTYVIFAMLEYDEDNRHYSESASGVVRIVEKKQLLFLPYWLIVLIILALVVVFISVQFPRKRKKIEK